VYRHLRCYQLLFGQLVLQRWLLQPRIGQQQCIAQDAICPSGLGGGTCSNNACGPEPVVRSEIPAAEPRRGSAQRVASRVVPVPLATSASLRCEDAVCCGIGTNPANRTCSTTNLVCQQTVSGGSATTLACKACGAVAGQPCCGGGTATARTCSAANLVCQTTGGPTGRHTHARPAAPPPSLAVRIGSATPPSTAPVLAPERPASRATCGRHWKGRRVGCLSCLRCDTIRPIFSSNV